MLHSQPGPARRRPDWSRPAGLRFTAHAAGSNWRPPVAASRPCPRVRAAAPIKIAAGRCGGSVAAQSRCRSAPAERRCGRESGHPV